MDSFKRVYGVYDFIDGSPGVGTLSSIFKPTLPEDADDCGALINIWIKSEKVLSIRWPQDYSKLLVCPNVYDPSNPPKDCPIRCGKLVMISDDMDELRKKAMEMAKQKRIALSNLQNNPACVKNLQFGASQQEDSIQKENVNEVVSAKSSSTTTGGQKRSSEEAPGDLLAKVQRLEASEKGNLAIIEQLKFTLRTQEEEMDKVCNEKAEIENELYELKERLEAKDADSNPTQMAKDMKESLQTLKALLDAQQNQPRQSNLLLTPPSSRPGSSSKQMMTLKGDILIDKDTVLSAVATGKRNGDTDRSLNSFIKTLLLSYWKDEELAKLCLTGAACPSIPGSVPKEKFPEHYADAICHFTVKKWAEMHKTSKYTDIDVRASITANLLNAHTRAQRLRKKQNTPPKGPNAKEKDDQPGGNGDNINEEAFDVAD